MAKRDVISKVTARMRERDERQKDVAVACGMSQPHLSKVLNKKVKLARKTSDRLERWLANEAGEPPDGNTVLNALGTKMAYLRPRRRMQIMELLRAIERLL
jgi:transcriptional regulator with XRE-family HTH domain